MTNGSRTSEELGFSNWTDITLQSSTQDLSLLKTSFEWMEITTALLGLLVNCMVIAAIAFGRTVTSRGYFFGLLNLSVAQNFLSLVSILAVTVPYCVSSSKSASTTIKVGWFRPLLHNTFTAIFSGLGVTGVAAMSFIQWWSSNIWVNHYQLPSGLRIAQVTLCVLWGGSLLFVVWLNSYQWMRFGLTITEADDDERSSQIYVRLYATCLFFSALWLIFSNTTSIPAVTGHLTTRAISTKPNHNCCDADCVCSESEADLSLKADPRASKLAATENRSSKMDIGVIPTIVAGTEFQEIAIENCSPSSNKSQRLATSMYHAELAVPNLLQIGGRDSKLSSFSRMSYSPYRTAGTSIYSADLSADLSTVSSPKIGQSKLSGDRLQRRLQKLANIRRMPPPDPEEEEEEEPQSVASDVKRKKKKRKPTKKLKSVVRLQFKRLGRVQLADMTAFFLLYIPPCFILMAAVHYPLYSSVMLSLFRIFVNMISSIIPLLLAMRHPRFRLTPRSWRSKIRPATACSLVPPTRKDLS